MLAIGRALMARPRLLLLDEPSMGLAPIIVQGIFSTLKEINAEGLTIFLVEQNVRQALKIAQHGYVLETGKVVLEHGAQSAGQSPCARSVSGRLRFGRGRGRGCRPDPAGVRCKTDG